MNEFIQSIKNKFNKIDKNYFVIILIGLLLMVPLMSYFYINGHDTQFHLGNSTILKNYLNNGGLNLFNLKIVDTSAYNFGYGIGIFYPRFAHSIIAYLSCLTGGVVTAAKVYQFIVIVLSGIFMYKLIKRITNNRNSALIGTIFYMCAPYFVSDFYVRSALAECLNFIFTPMIFLGIYDYLYLNNRRNFFILFIIGFIGVVNSHLVTGVFLVIFVLIFLLFNMKRVLKKQVILDFVLASLIVLAYCSPFLVLMIQHKLFGNVAIFLKDFMGNPGWSYGTALNLSDYLSLTPNEKNFGITFYLNIIMVIMAFYSIINYKKIEKQLNGKNIVFPLIVLSICSIILSTKIIPWYKLPDMFQLIQFPWRLQIFVVFFLSILSSFIVVTWDNTKTSLFKPIIICASIVIALNSIDYTRLNFFSLADISIYPMGSQREYLPVNTLNNVGYLENRREEVIIKDGKANVDILSNSVPEMEFDVDLESSKTTLELPRLYYFGYRIMQNTSDGLRKIEYKENDKGFIELDLKSSGKVTVEYVGTKLYRVCRIIKFLTIILIGIYILIKLLKKRGDQMMKSISKTLNKIKNKIYTRKNIEFIKKNQCKILFLMGALITLPYLVPHFALDSYTLLCNSYINYSTIFFKAGRIVSGAFYCLFEILHLPFNTVSVLSTILSIVILTLSIKELLDIIELKNKDTKSKYIIILILCFSMLYNFMSMEFFVFMESFVMFLGVLCCLKSLKHLLLDAKKNKVISLLYLILAISCYQGVLCMYIPLVLFFVLTDNISIKEKISKIILSIIYYGISFVYSFILIKISNLLLKTADVKTGNMDIIYNIKYIPKLIKNTFTTLFDFYNPKLFYLLLITLLVCLICLKSKNRLIKLANILLILVSIIVFAFVPNVVMSSTANYTAPRMLISIGMIIPVIILYIVLNYDMKLNKIINIVVIIICLVNFSYVSFNYFRNFNIGIKTYSRDQKYVSLLANNIERYEKDKKIKIKDIYYGFDTSVNYHYDDGGIVNGFNFRASAIPWAVSWAFTGLLKSNLRDDYNFILMTSEEVKDIFGEVNYDNFDSKQLKFEEDTVYILLY